MNVTNNLNDSLRHTDREEKLCTHCEGEGSVNGEWCYRCEGSGSGVLESANKKLAQEEFKANDK